MQLDSFLSSGVTHVHKHGCRDAVRESKRRGEYLVTDGNTDWHSKEEFGADLWSDINAESWDDGDKYDWQDDIKWYPCTDELPDWS